MNPNFDMIGIAVFTGLDAEYLYQMGWFFSDKELGIGASDGGALKIYSIIASAFYWPYPHMKRR
jgi:hypothetical protein